MWADFMDELRTAHLGTPPTGRPSVAARLQAAYEAMVAQLDRDSANPTD